MKLTEKQLQLLVGHLIKEAKKEKEFDPEDPETDPDKGIKEKISRIKEGSVITVFREDDSVPFIKSKVEGKGRVRTLLNGGQNINPMDPAMGELGVIDDLLDSIFFPVVIAFMSIATSVTVKRAEEAAPEGAGSNLSSPDRSLDIAGSNLEKLGVSNTSDGLEIGSALNFLARNKNLVSAARKKYSISGEPPDYESSINIDGWTTTERPVLTFRFGFDDTEVLQDAEFSPDPSAKIVVFFDTKGGPDKFAKAEKLFNAAGVYEENKSIGAEVATQKIEEAFQTVAGSFVASFSVTEPLPRVIRHLELLDRTGLYRIEVESQ